MAAVSGYSGGAAPCLFGEWSWPGQLLLIAPWITHQKKNKSRVGSPVVPFCKMNFTVICCKDLRALSGTINQIKTVNAKKQPFINFLSKGKWIRSITALFLNFCHFLKENATVFRWSFILRTERDKRKWGSFLLPMKAAVFRLRQKSEHVNTRCTARLTIKHTSTYQPKCSPIEWASSSMINFLPQYQRQCNEWFSSVVVSYLSWHTFIFLLTWGVFQSSMCQIQPAWVKYCCVKLWSMKYADLGTA